MFTIFILLQNYAPRRPDENKPEILEITSSHASSNLEVPCSMTAGYDAAMKQGAKRRLALRKKKIVNAVQTYIAGRDELVANRDFQRTVHIEIDAAKTEQTTCEQDTHDSVDSQVKTKKRKHPAEETSTTTNTQSCTEKLKLDAPSALSQDLLPLDMGATGLRSPTTDDEHEIFDFLYPTNDDGPENLLHIRIPPSIDTENPSTINVSELDTAGGHHTAEDDELEKLLQPRSRPTYTAEKDAHVIQHLALHRLGPTDRGRNSVMLYISLAGREQDRPRGIRLASDSYVSRWMNYYRKHRVRMDAEITHIVAEKTAAPSSHSATCVAGSSNTLVARIPNPTSRAATLLEPSHVSRTLASTHLADIRSHPAGDTDWVTSSNEGRGVKAESAQDAASVRAIQPLAEEVSSGNPCGKKLRIRGSCFTEKEDALLAAYIASVLPNPRDRGRTGPRLYMALVERAQTEKEKYGWAAARPSGTRQSRYARYRVPFDEKIAAIIAESEVKTSHGLVI
ncbi:hypothetical protein BDV98DRAFT_583145 [Pterulicium gracile]|uniref:Uncharacterized protein n=1 Tax=Pterulicium gracile TaxID=1884261 RepID=A0A5C3QRY4_9AGAR|nr:hypothetical protein BDV98DRAFT_583145 [Pterula gracilis]